MGEEYTGPVYTGYQKSGVSFNPLLHFGCKNIKNNSDKSMIEGYEICTSGPPVIQSYAYSDKSESCGEGVPIVIQSQKEALPLILENTLYRKEAFWAIPLAKCVDEMDIWSYIIQRIISHHNYLYQIHDMYFMGPEYKFVNSSKIQSIIGRNLDDIGLGEKYVGLTSVLHNFAESHNNRSEWVQWQMAWIESINKSETVGVKSPPNCLNNKVILRPWKTFGDTFKYPILRKKYGILCSHFPSADRVDIRRPGIQYSDMALIVLYNYAVDRVMPVVEILYGPFFPIILHCSPRSKNPRDFEKIKDFSFIEYFTGKNLNYQCVYLASLLRFPVKGFLFMADDITLTTPDIQFFPPDKCWTYSGISACDTKNRGNLYRGLSFKTCARWLFVTKRFRKMQRALKQFPASSHFPIFKKCAKNLNSLIQFHSPHHIEVYLMGISDIYYIPEKMMHDAVQMINFFLKYEVHLEIAVPTALYCISGKASLVGIPGAVLWEKARDNVTYYLQKLIAGHGSFIHPIKWSRLLKNDNGMKKNYCERLMPFLHKNNSNHKGYTSVIIR